MTSGGAPKPPQDPGAPAPRAVAALPPRRGQVRELLMGAGPAAAPPAPAPAPAPPRQAPLDDDDLVEEVDPEHLQISLPPPSRAAPPAASPVGLTMRPPLAGPPRLAPPSAGARARPPAPAPAAAPPLPTRPPGRLVAAELRASMPVPVAPVGVDPTLQAVDVVLPSLEPSSTVLVDMDMGMGMDVETGAADAPDAHAGNAAAYAPDAHAAYAAADSSEARRVDELLAARASLNSGRAQGGRGWALTALLVLVLTSTVAAGVWWWLSARASAWRPRPTTVAAANDAPSAAALAPGHDLGPRAPASAGAAPATPAPASVEPAAAATATATATAAAAATASASATSAGFTPAPPESGSPATAGADSAALAGAAPVVLTAVARPSAVTASAAPAGVAPRDRAPHKTARPAPRPVAAKVALKPPPARPEGSPAAAGGVDLDVAAGKHALLTGGFEEAAAAFGRATKAAPARADAWRGLGIAEEKRGHRDAAVKAYKRYLSLSPGAADHSVIEGRVAALEHK